MDFPTAEDVLKAVALSEQNLDGRKLLIKASSDFTGRPNSVLPILDSSALVPSVDGQQQLNRDAKRILDKQKNSNGGTLFLGNLGFETTIETIRTLFDENQKDVGIIINVVDGEEVEEAVDEFGERIKVVDEDRESDDDDDEEDEEEVEEAQMVMDESTDLTSLPVIKLERKPKREKGIPLDLTKAKDAGIRKIRIGTFEDTGKCKGSVTPFTQIRNSKLTQNSSWAFVDFHLPAQCTRALLNIKNHTLDGRTLNIEYASAEAVRRGGIGTRAAIPSDRGRGGMRGGRGSDRGSARGGGRGGAGGARGKGREWDDEDTTSASKEYVDYSEPSERERAPRGEFGFRPDSGRGRGGERGTRGRGAGRGRGGAAGTGSERIKSGAALALAARGKEAGIIESTGKKITFD